MTFSQRERFIYHAITLMTISNLGKLAKDGFNKKIHAIRNSRCKNLTDEQIEEILLDVEREIETCLTSRMPKYNAFTRTPKVEKLRKQGYKKREFSETIQEEWK